MQDFFDRHGKKFIVGVGIVLMLAFLLPSVPQFGGGGNAVIGTIDGKKVNASEVQQAVGQLQLLQRVYTRDTNPNGSGQMIPIVAAAFGGSEQMMRRLSDDPETWFLLTREADRAGITPSEDALNEALALVGVSTEAGVLTQYDKINPTQQPTFREAVRQLFAVRYTYEHARAGIVMSRPVVRFASARFHQKIDLRLVDMGVAGATSQPTTDAELQRHFDQFAAVAPGTFEPKTNPHGFGYRVPDRVKIDLISLPYAELRRVAKAAKSDYAWDVDAQKYYLTHPDEFLPPAADEAKQPATTQASTTQASTTQASTTQVAGQPASAPAVRPFPQVRDEIVNRMIETSVADLRKAASARITSMLQADYDAWARSAAASQPVKKDVKSYDYLKSVAADVYKQLGVQPDTASYGDAFRSAADLNALSADVSKAQNFDIEALQRGRGGMESFGQTVVAVARPLLAGERPAGDAVLFRPSKPIASLNASYVFRITEVSPSHPAVALADVRPQVEKDLRLVQSFEQAKKLAEQAVPLAKSGGLATAAAGKPVLTTGLFAYRGDEKLESMSFAPEVRYEFIEEAFKLLFTPDAKGPPAYGVVALPRAGKVYLAELTNVAPDWTSATEQTAIEQAVAQQLVLTDRGQASAALAEWIGRDQVVHRINYVPSGRDNAAPSPTPAPPPPSPFR